MPRACVLCLIQWCLGIILREQGEVDNLTVSLKAGTLELVKYNFSQINEPLGIMMIDIDNVRPIKYDMALNFCKRKWQRSLQNIIK